MKISACVIVKNEEKNLPRWIENMKQFADELIVVDTGSTDRTAAIARESGARVYEFPWKNDFAAAKNFAIKKAKGDWIAFLDADEAFSPETVGRVRPLIKQIQRENKRIVGVVCKLINFDEDQDYKIINAVFQLRIFRNTPKIRYEGAIHERLVDMDAAKHKNLSTTELVIHHTGYSSSRVREKLHRNLDLLMEKHAGKDDGTEDAFYFAECYIGLGEYEKALSYAQRVVDSGESYMGREGAEYHQLIHLKIHLGAEDEEIEELFDRAMARYPDMAIFPYDRAILAWEKKDYAKAREWMEKADALYAEEQQVIREDRVVSRLPRICLVRGGLLDAAGRTMEALSSYVDGLKRFPRDVSLFQKVYKAIQDAPPVDIIEILNAIYASEKDLEILVAQLKAFRPSPVLAYYMRKLPAEEQEAALLYWAVGSYEKASEVLASELERAMDALVMAAKNEMLAKESGESGGLQSEERKNDALGI
ncbi:hypothetical protein TAMA11512_22250 [Selenomonas sp. TAMA-11512]|uniref:tetratricopeptide repeat-containing glycosyltransferase family 2 protein n=1 Tax=Selenomonas sp. TAMA-11512 TaxID=3095337 RepID=UPI00308EFC2A|nr:hypothetical protein TAMA11512_22250 [Selenomonas sp. TAMA-11512]